VTGSIGYDSKRRTQRRRVTAVGLVAAIVLGACGSGGRSETSGSSSTTAAATSAGQSTQAQQAAAFLKGYTTPPSTISITQPLTSAPPAGKSIYYLQCEQPQCQQVGLGVKAAATIAGWTFKSIPFLSTNPSTLVTGLNQALQEGATTVAIVAEPYALWSAVVPKFQAAHVPIIAMFVGPATIGSTVIANVSDPAFSALNGKILADWFISESNAQGHVLLANVPDYPYLGLVGDSFASNVARGCSGCQVTTLNVGIPDVASGAINSQIVSALQKDPSIKYVMVADVAFAQALPGALAAAGRNGKVKILGCCAAAAEEAGLPSGQFAAMTGVGGFYAGFLAVDAALRHAEGLPIPANEGAPSVGLLTMGSNVVPADSYDVPNDYAQQFKALWKLG
jgi:ribose transport system substrate-binding protein